MPKKRSKEPNISQEAWEKEVPPLTEEQLKNQADILKKLGKSVLGKVALLKKQQAEKRMEEWYVTDVEVHLPQIWYPETPPDELEEI